MNTAIIVAAGSGKRFGSDIPKQFIEIDGKPLIIHTLERFEACRSVDEIVLVLSENGRDEFVRTKLGSHITKLRSVVTGGTTRAGSVLNGLLAAAENAAAEVVAVHDGARPLISVDEIDRVIAEAHRSGAACLVASVTDTIKSIRGGEIAATLDRDKLRRAMTPQCFRIDILQRAFENAQLDDTVTDECFLVERLGYPISFVEGSSKNVKVTTQDDLAFVETFLKS